MSVRILVAGPDKRDAYLQPYKDAVSSIRGEAVRDWPSAELIADDERLAAFLAQFQGILLPGGPDVDPDRYGERRHSGLGPTDRELDEGELAIARLARARGVRTLAICRGLQMAVVEAGGKLYQDLSSERPSGVNHRISAPKDALAHGVELAPGSRLAQLCGSPSFEVNSRHHQAARDGEVEGRVGPFVVVARAPDGVIEGLELPSHPFFMAVQWHPEDLVAKHTPSRRLFEGFLSACRL